MAAAVTTGVVALMKDEFPQLTPNLAKAALQFTAMPMSDDRRRALRRAVAGHRCGERWAARFAC